jgi:RNA polymerase sigma-70 factor (ECF subfamily)
MDALVSPLQLEEVIRRHEGQLRAAAFRILSDREEAEDAVQDGLLSAHEALPHFRGAARLSTWLHRIVVNAALMRLRAHRRRPERTLRLGDLAASDLALVGLRSMSTPEDRCAARETVDRLVKRIDTLPPGQRQVLEMGVFEGLAHGEIARRNGETRGAVKLRLHRARCALRGTVDRASEVTTPRNPRTGTTSEARTGIA